MGFPTYLRELSIRSNLHSLSEEEFINGIILVLGFILSTVIGVLCLWIVQKYCCISKQVKDEEEGFSPPPKFEAPPPYPGECE